jgi:hypothetical protein
MRYEETLPQQTALYLNTLVITELNHKFIFSRNTLIFSTASSLVAFTVWVAPRVLAFWSFSSRTSTAMISEAPKAFAICKQLQGWSYEDTLT